ncbi:MAG: hypothetical protein IKM48_07385 [Clostridia bacterium]|nr:hypothetical protein [Clostridia bacterium]
MKTNRITAFLLLFLLVFSLCSCQKEKLVFEIHEDSAEITDDKFYGYPDLIVKVTPQSIEKEYFTNPDGDFNQNAHVTVFDLTVSEVYKGTWNDDTIQIKMLNGEGLSEELYLYGEDETYVLEEKVDPFLLDLEKEYILGLVFMDPQKYNCFNDPGGYTILYGKTWTFVKNEKGLYENLDHGMNHKELDIETLKNKIATAS